MTGTPIAILHYSAPPVAGGVESVISAQARLFRDAGYAPTVIAGVGNKQSLPAGTNFVAVPEMDSRHPLVAECARELEGGRVTQGFETASSRLEDLLRPMLAPFDHVLVHNIFTKHFNLPLTAALARLLERGDLAECVAWCHDFSWSSPHSRGKLFNGYPWDLLRTYQRTATYVVISKARQAELAALMQVPADQIHVIYAGVDPGDVLGLSLEGQELIGRLGLWASGLVLLMPVRITRAKNIEFALQVASELKRAGRRPRLVITGPPDLLDRANLDYFEGLKSLRARLQLEEEVRFVSECGPQADIPYVIEPRTVGELYRLSDLVFMPSLREGFGLPILEAGLAGIPVVSTEIPAAQEIGERDVTAFSANASPAEVAQLITRCIDQSPASRLRRKVRQRYTWAAIFAREIQPMLKAIEVP